MVFEELGSHAEWILDKLRDRRTKGAHKVEWDAYLLLAFSPEPVALMREIRKGMVHLPVFEANARNRASLVAAMNTTPPPVAMLPPRFTDERRLGRA